MVPKSGAFMFDALLGPSPESALSPASSGASSPCSPRAAAPRSADKRPRALSSELAASESVQSIKRRPPAERPLGAQGRRLLALLLS
jgi:hypothetical protein